MPDELVPDVSTDSSSIEPEPDVVAPDSPDVPDGEPDSDEKDPPFHTHPRWQKLNRELEEWRSLGDRESISTKLQQAEAYEAHQLRQWQLQQAQSLLKQPPQYGPQYTPEEVAVRNDLIRLFPQLKEIDRMVQQMSELGQNVTAQKQATVYRGQELITKFSRDLGVTSQHGGAAVENAITAIIAANPQELHRFRAGDLGTVERAIEIYKTEVLEPIRRATTSSYAQTKQRTSNLPNASTISGRGTPARPVKKEADDTPDARAEAGWAIIQGSRK